MKLLIFVISLFIIGAQSQRRGFDLKGCMAELGMSDEVKFGDPKSRCILACAFKKEGLVKDGKMVFDVAFNITKEDKQTLNDKENTERVNICIENAHKEANECDVSFVFLRCMTDGPQATN